jgi:hypothetical protein
MHITPDMMEGAYRLLLTTLPFRRWRLPDPDDMAFRVSKHQDRHAHFRNHRGIKEICISQVHAKGVEKLVRDIAHELIHMRLDDVGDSRVNHGPKFRRLAIVVCQRHKWELERFISE